MAGLRRLPPIWVMGLGFIPLGANGTILLITAPQLLAANHVPEARIAAVTTIGLFPSFASFILGPILDWRFSRRSYAISLTLVGTACAYAALLAINNLVLLTTLLFLANLAISLVVAAVGGWFGNLVKTEQQGPLAAWLNAGNAAAFGIAAGVAMELLRGLPYALGAAILASFILTALPLYWLLPCPKADQRLASESFRLFMIDVLAVLKKPAVQWTLALFLLPAASFALTNTLGGLGRDFHTSEAMVGFWGGAGTAIAGVAGSLIIPHFERFAPARPLYLWVGGVGAVFTLVLAAAPHNPATFGAAMVGENLFQGAAFSVQNLIIFRTIGPKNPLAATQFGLLTAAMSLPLDYMQMVDGAAYGLFGGARGSFLADALVSGGFCLLLAGVMWAFRGQIARKLALA